MDSFQDKQSHWSFFFFFGEKFGKCWIFESLILVRRYKASFFFFFMWIQEEKINELFDNDTYS